MENKFFSLIELFLPIDFIDWWKRQNMDGCVLKFSNSDRTLDSRGWIDWITWLPTLGVIPIFFSKDINLSLLQSEWLSWGLWLQMTYDQDPVTCSQNWEWPFWGLWLQMIYRDPVTGSRANPFWLTWLITKNWLFAVRQSKQLKASLTKKRQIFKSTRIPFPFLTVYFSLIKI